MIPELFIRAEADDRTQRRLRAAAEYRLARHVPSRASRNKLPAGRTGARTTRRAVALRARRIGWASRGLS
jgi:hypothetical protein